MQNFSIFLYKLLNVYLKDNSFLVNLCILFSGSRIIFFTFANDICTCSFENIKFSIKNHIFIKIYIKVNILVSPFVH